MYAISVSMEVNPAGVKPRLTLGELWRGLEIKCEDPVPFVNGIPNSVPLETTTVFLTFAGP